MANQSFDKLHNRFFLDLHGVLQRDATRAITKRIDECRTYGIDQLTVVYGTPDTFEGSIASELHQILTESTPPGALVAQISPDFLRDPESFTRRFAQLIVPIRPSENPEPQDEKMEFVPFKASRETDLWQQRLCQNYYRPLLEWVLLTYAARYIGDGCQPEGLRALAEELPGAERADDPRKFRIHTGTLKQLAEAWWSQTPATAGERATQAQVAEPAPSPRSDVPDPVPVPAPEVPDWEKEWQKERKLGRTALMAGEYTEALRRLHGCLERAEKYLCETPAVGGSLLAIAECHEIQCQYREAEDYYRLALDSLSALSNSSPEELVQAEMGLAQLLPLTGKKAEAADLWAKVRTQLQNTGMPDISRIVFALANESKIRYKLDNTERAITLLTEALELATTGGRRVPEAVVGDLRFGLALLQYGAGRFNESLHLFQQVVHWLESRQARSGGSLFECLFECRLKIGDLHRQLGRPDESQAILKAILDSDGIDVEDQARTLSQLGIGCRKRGQLDLAESCYREALNLLGSMGAPDECLLGNLNENLGVIYKHRRRFPEAEACYQQALHIFEGLFGRDHRKVAEVLNNLALLYSEWNRPDVADQLFERALEIRKVFLPPDHPDLAFTYYAYGCHLAKNKEYDRADELLRKALQIRHSKYGDCHPDTVRSLANLCSLRLMERRYTEAARFAKRAIKASPNSTLLPELYAQLSSAYHGMGNEKWARKALRRAKKLGYGSQERPASLDSRSSGTYDTGTVEALGSASESDAAEESNRPKNDSGSAPVDPSADRDAHAAPHEVILKSNEVVVPRDTVESSAKIATASQYCQEGDAFSGERNYEAAIQAYRRAIECDAKYIGAWIRLGATYIYRNQLQEAIETLLDALRIAPDCAGVCYYLGVAFGNAGCFVEALEAFEQTKRLDPNVPMIDQNLRMARANRDLMRKEQRESAATYLRLGEMRSAGGRKEEAIAAFEASLAVDPSTPQCYSSLCGLYASCGQTTAALRWARRWLTVQPDSADAHFSLGSLLFLDGQCADALAHLSKAADIRPDFVVAINLMGEILNGMGASREAESMFERVLKIDPANKDALASLCACRCREGRTLSY
jgi:tetratricopeptide (TPR) repeat protein